MSREQLIRLVADAERDPALREELRGCFAAGQSWTSVVGKARLRGYEIQVTDLQDARSADHAASFLEASRVSAIGSLWGSSPVLPSQAAQLAARRQASTAR
ncbi:MULTISPECIES: Nif11-like leader peptide family natural product precursor [unclassified Synechococcus]|uniref:Nif11-like leader peptide family natural product precursor n=1 Tax=unclassified Synechococcus TaxID=2626047 RepID=UPI0018CDA701|nr:Nif11 family protein [Synechococcus sp. CBW1002]QPN66110.1 Nif11 family protein [Synechococcus sp. CBW1006]CAK6695609.1 hypothetical protein IFHNHDMJ_01858 [Synechococcus sp. CBW1107]